MAKCKECTTEFTVKNEDKGFLESISFNFNGKKYLFPDPLTCPRCRARRRMAWRNERELYRRKCDLCQKAIIAMYRAEAKFPVYCSDCWWGDKWDPYAHGRDFDFSKPFFEQFMDLHNAVAHFDRAVLESTMENADYCNHAGYLKNCYLLVNADESEQCLYGKGMNRCFDCLDCLKIYDCRSCYESVNCTNCTFCTYLIDCHNSNDCHFGANLVGCSDCFGCVNLRNKQYHIYNKPYSKEEYQEKVAQIRAEKTQTQLWEDFKITRKTHPVKWMREKQTENCTGDYLAQCKDCFECYDCEYLENSKYCNDLKKGDKISFENYDISYFGMGVDRSYESSVAGYNTNHIAFCENVWQSYDVLYSMLCVSGSHDLFGCFGLKKGEYSVLNKKYSREEYNKLVPKIIEHMRRAGEWGEFFPISSSPLGYNESTANEHYPMSKAEVLAKKWQWHEEKEPDYSHISKKIKASLAPPDISKVPDEVLNWALICEKSGRLFQIQKAELVFYRKMNLSLPLYHPDLRHNMRNGLRNERKLYERPCSKCGSMITTTYKPNSLEQVYCQKCYLQAIY